MTRILVIALGGALGALSRYGATLLVGAYWKRDFPLATFLISVSGAFILGLFLTFAAERAALDASWRLFVATGFLGAYTTFSTFELETQRLAEGGALRLALLNVIASVTVGFVAVQLGVSLARR